MRNAKPTRDSAERTLPHSLDAERAVLGAILLHASAFDAVSDVLAPSDFFRDAHARMYQAVESMVDRGVPVEFASLREELIRLGELDAVGGPAYLAALVDGLPRSTNVRHYADLVKEHSRLRTAIHVGTKLAGRAYDGEERAADLAGETVEVLSELGATGSIRPMSLRDLWIRGIESIEQAHAAKGAVTGLATGYVELDDLTSGLHGGDVTLIAARPSIGKTAMAMNIARNVAAATPVLVFSLEMTKEQLFLRMLAAEANVDGHRLRSGFLGEKDWTLTSEAAARLAELPLLVDDTSHISVLEIRAKARQMRSERGLGLLVIDYVQLMKGRGKPENRTEEVGQISRGLKGLAKELSVPVIALSQLRRPDRGADNRRPQLSDLRNSGELEQDADVVLFLWRKDPTMLESHEAEIIIGKQRNGPRGTVKVIFQPGSVRFDNPSMI